MRQSARISGLALMGLVLAVSGSWAAEKTNNFRQTLTPLGNQVRIANLAGRIELVPGGGSDVVVEATVHAEGRNDGETQRLLQEMKWVRSRDKEGREEWALAYPVDDYKAFHYPRKNQDESDLPDFLSFLENGYSSTYYRGEKVRIYSQRRSSAPTLYANLKISLPAGSQVAVRNVIGPVNGTGALQANLTIKTGSGDVRIASHAGQLNVDTGSGNVTVGAVRGETTIDTGSGDVTVRRMVGNGGVDTGSGNVTVENVSAGRLSIDTGSGDVVVRQGTASRVLADTGSGNVSVLGVELEELDADTGSGDVTVQSSLAKARRVTADTGSGNVRISAGPDASFDIESDQGSGELRVGYSDAVLRKSGRKVTGAKRGDGRTVIRVETGSGDCIITPRGEE
ncbi:MAG TPA: DUF4097 family beta strand repeat-containing protein [Thermoanaerobaculia bacterium]|nr:DUF4097 family beta strand repeat-containing protein [Thermoanaerobaculia bacterium]